MDFNKSLKPIILLGALLLYLVLIPVAQAQFSVAPSSCPPGFVFVPPDSCEPEVEPDPNPVVIVPGILASLNLQTTLLDESGGQWDFLPPVEPIYRGLIERLRAAGIDVFVAHYDWRKPAAETSVQYLKAAIDHAKAETGAEKVDLVAHSMGGIVSRAYIQGAQYGNDVDQLITLGTPHKGAADAYVAWEGGELPNRWSPAARGYLRIVETSLKVATGAEALLRPESFRTFFPSLHDLLPTEPFVNKDGSLVPFGNLVGANNLFLKQLNDTIAKIGQRNVRLATIGSTNIGTLGAVPISQDRTLLDDLLARWRDGHPSPEPPAVDTTTGDRTVLLSSALMGNNKMTILNARHDKLPEEAQEEVLALLDHVEATGSHIAYELPESIVGIAALSPVMPTITGPGGETLSAAEDTFSDASFIWDSTNPTGPKLLVISNPPNGEYAITLDPIGDGGTYHVVTSFADSDETKEHVVEGSIGASEKDAYTFSVSDENPLFAVETFDVKIALEEITTLAKQAHKNKLISGFEQASIIRAVNHEDIEELEGAVRDISKKPGCEALARDMTSRIELIKRLSPPLR